MGKIWGNPPSFSNKEFLPGLKNIFSGQEKAFVVIVVFDFRLTKFAERNGFDLGLTLEEEGAGKRQWQEL